MSIEKEVYRNDVTRIEKDIEKIKPKSFVKLYLKWGTAIYGAKNENNNDYVFTVSRRGWSDESIKQKYDGLAEENMSSTDILSDFCSDRKQGRCSGENKSGKCEHWCDAFFGEKEELPVYGMVLENGEKSMTIDLVVPPTTSSNRKNKAENILKIKRYFGKINRLKLIINKTDIEDIGLSENVDLSFFAKQKNLSKNGEDRFIKKLETDQKELLKIGEYEFSKKLEKDLASNILVNNIWKDINKMFPGSYPELKKFARRKLIKISKMVQKEQKKQEGNLAPNIEKTLFEIATEAKRKIDDFIGGQSGSSVVKDKTVEAEISAEKILSVEEIGKDIDKIDQDQNSNLAKQPDSVVRKDDLIGETKKRIDKIVEDQNKESELVGNIDEPSCKTKVMKIEQNDSNSLTLAEQKNDQAEDSYDQIVDNLKYWQDSKVIKFRYAEKWLGYDIWREAKDGVTGIIGKIKSFWAEKGSSSYKQKEYRNDWENDHANMMKQYKKVKWIKDDLSKIVTERCNIDFDQEKSWIDQLPLVEQRETVANYIKKELKMKVDLKTAIDTWGAKDKIDKLVTEINDCIIEKIEVESENKKPSWLDNIKNRVGNFLFGWTKKKAKVE